MDVEDKVRNVSAGLAKLAEHYDLILGTGRRSKESAKLGAFLLKSLGDSIEAKAIASHAMAINGYALKHKGEVSGLVRSQGIDKAFFGVARRVFEEQEAVEVVKTVLAILAEMKASILAQRAAIDDLTHVEKEEFIHLADWGLKHSIGRKEKVHLTDFAHKLERQIHWVHGNDKHNDMLFRRLVEQEQDLATRHVHLYIISLIKLRHCYENLAKVFDKQITKISEEEKVVKGMLKEHFREERFQKDVVRALHSAQSIKELVSAEGTDMMDLLHELKEVEHRIPKIERHKAANRGPFLTMEGHQVQVEGVEDKHPHRIQLNALFDLKDSSTLLLGSDEVCHILLHHCGPVHARIARKDGKFYLFNEGNSPGTFVIRKKQPICIVQDKDDQHQLITRMNMPGEDYADIVRKEKMIFSINPQDSDGFLLQEMDLIVIPPGYKFRYTEK
ncbi:TPA: hypothetical protein HA265_08355 [Candidatus Woesearchaeota archaeon]|nr:hypothetical protein [Candidatus Woesearchaeota archaeon]